MANSKLPYKLVEHKTEDIPHFDYGTIKKMSEDEDLLLLLLIEGCTSSEKANYEIYKSL